MQSSIQPEPSSKKMLWAGRIISALPALFLLMDVVMKLFKTAPVVEETVRLGYPDVMFGLGLVLLACTVLYVIPKTSVLGAILLTGLACPLRLMSEWHMGPTKIALSRI